MGQNLCVLYISRLEGLFPLGSVNSASECVEIEKVVREGMQLKAFFGRVTAGLLKHF